jgi:uncharacterized protein
MQAMLTALKKAGRGRPGHPDPELLGPSPIRDGQRRAPCVTGYQVSSQLQVRLEDVTELGAMLDALVTAGANQINGVQFSVRDPTALLAETREKAVVNARAKAETFAKAAGVTLGPILSVNESGNGAPCPLFLVPQPASPSVPTALGEETIGADVTITWQIQ